MTARRHWNIHKLRPDGSISTTYHATEIDSPPGWVAAEAIWPFQTVDIGFYTFEPNDRLEEFFSLDRWYNLFVVFRPSGELVGWYCNVTHPTRIEGDNLYWHDLWVDVIITADGELHVVDEDELEESGIAESDPELHATILAARDELIALYRENRYPFSLHHR